MSDPASRMASMRTQLFSVSKIFTERIFRIPDYQRGYAWTEKQLIDFWGDIDQLEDGKNHYTGVLTMEDVPDPVIKRWVDDHWIIYAKQYSPYYIVDGQQRLTTVIILIQAISESIRPDAKLNYTSVEEIRKKFIYDSKDDGISRSYIFGYETDNPSYEFLKKKIFLERSDAAFSTEETIYTHNLERAKKFFIERLGAMAPDEIEGVYRKVTQHLLFNIYSISEDVDVHVAFETMTQWSTCIRRTQGKSAGLSHLESIRQNSGTH